MSGSLFPTDEEIPGLLVGPESVTWRFASDTRLYFTMLYPLLMQVAHPTVGAGVRDFSDFDERPWNRLIRTLDYVTALVYGGDDAVAVGRRLRALHKGFQGTREDGQRYYALEPTAYAWVHATLLDAYVRGHAHFGTPMRPDQLERFYAEYRGLGRLVGVREHDLPDDWQGFQEYFDAMVATGLEHTESVDRVLHSVKHAVPPPIPFPDPLWRAVRAPARRGLWLGGVGLLPPLLRERFGLTWTRRDERQFRRLGALTRALTPVLPKQLRVVGPAQLRMRRRAIARGPLGRDGQEVGRQPAAAEPAGAAKSAAPV
jgi:uncharacterized protein (DUF2236 family)